MNAEKLLSLKVLELRKARRLTQRQFGEIGDVSGPYINNIEKGLRFPSLELVFQLEKGLGLSEPELSSLVIQVAYEKAIKKTQAKIV